MQAAPNQSSINQHDQLSDEQRTLAVDDNRTQHVRLVFAIHRLEACLGQAAPGREAIWMVSVSEALDLLITAMRESTEVACRDNGLIEDIRLSQPRLLTRIETLRDEFEGLIQQALTLQDQLANAKQRSQTDFGDLRQRIDWLLSAIRHHQAKEVDLIYEALHVDIGVGD